ncbi:MAG: hypothetical protein KDE68_00470 [Rhodocyclaceae bacterium]|nr:hypothetical protein [Rhodocyclaceae bacterium]
MYRAIALAFDTKAQNRTLDRLAREGEYDWELVSDIRADAITTPLAKATDDEFADLIASFVEHIHTEYRNLSNTIPLDALSRDEALPLLIEYSFAPHGCAFLETIVARVDGPGLFEILDSDRQPIEVVLNWFGSNCDTDLAQTAYPDSTNTDRTDREMVRRWVTGKQLPDLQSITRFVRVFSSKHKALTTTESDNLRRWLVVARALTWFESNSPVPVRTIACRQFLMGNPVIDIDHILSSANIDAGGQFSALKMPTYLLYKDLKRTTPKAPGDQVRTKDKLDHLEQLFAEHDPEGRLGFHLSWRRGRWFALGGRFVDALPHFKVAVEQSHYRGGDKHKQILEEALVIAAHVGGEKPFLKQMKHRAIALGLFEPPKGQEVLEAWEIEHLCRQFDQKFPASGRFPEVQGETAKTTDLLPFLAFASENFDALKPDLRNPDRVVKMEAIDGQTRRWPQLGIFASEGNAAAVRALLAHGASVDQLDSSQGSAILKAIQRAQCDGNRDTLDILLAVKHDPVTLNTATTKKRITPLLVAVDYGEPDVVGKLLEMGANPDQRGDLDDRTPLYACLSIAGRMKAPGKVLEQFKQVFHNGPNAIQREMMRRYGFPWAGAFGDESLTSGPFKKAGRQELFMQVPDAFIQSRNQSHTEAKLLQIAELLLKAGADPNARHQHPVAGRTPLMLAAENDWPECFALMLTHGGDISLKDNDENDCTRIAIGFGSAKVAALMREMNA